MKLALGMIVTAAAIGQQQLINPPVETGKAAIEGAVVDSLSHSPIRKAAVMLSGHASLRAVTGDDGHFAFRQLPAGQYFLQAQSDKYPRARPVSVDLSNQASVSIAGDEDRTGVELSLTPGASIRGRVVDEEGSPMPQCSVTPTRLLTTETGKGFFDFNSAPSDDKGEYRIENVPPGKYYVVARCFLSIPMPHALVRREALGLVPMLTYAPLFYPGSPDFSGAARITLAPGTEMTGVDFQMMPAAGVPVRGRAQPVPANTNVQITLRPKDPLLRHWQQQGARLDARTGEFQIPSVRPGSYELVALTRGGASYVGNTPIEVTTTPPDPIELHLTPATQISGSLSVDGDLTVPLKNLHIFLSPSDDQSLGPVSAEIESDGKFSLSVAPGRWRVRINGATGYLKSMTAGDQQVSPEALEIGAGPVSLKIVYGTKNAQVDATVSGLPANLPLVYALVWSSDLDVQQTLPATAQAVTFNVPPGKYYTCATAAIQAFIGDRTFRNALASHCSTIEVAEGSHTSVQIPFISTEDLKRVAASLDEDGAAAF